MQCGCRFSVMVCLLTGSLQAQMHPAELGIADLAKLASEDWRSPEGADFIETRKRKASLFLPFKLAEKTVIELTVDSIDRTTDPKLALGFYEGCFEKGQYIEPWGDELVFLDGEDFMVLGEFPKPPWKVRLAVDPLRSELTSIAPRTGKVMRAKLKTPVGAKQGLWIQNTTGQLQIRGFRVVQARQGKEPRKLKESAKPRGVIGVTGKGADWKPLKDTKPRTVPFATLQEPVVVAVAPGSGGFRETPAFPEKWEIRVRMLKREEDSRCAVRVGVSQSASRFTTVEFVAEKNQVFARTDHKRDPEQPLNVVGRKNVTFRLFGRKGDNGGWHLAAVDPDGRQLLEIKQRRTVFDPKGISLQMDGTILRPSVVSEVELLEWDGKPPKPIPGG